MPAKPPASDVAIPNVFGDDQRAEAVAGAIMLGQQQIVQLEVQQRLNGHEDTTLLPDVQVADGQVHPTYGSRREQINTGLRLLMEDNADLHDAIVGLAEKWQAERAGAPS